MKVEEESKIARLERELETRRLDSLIDDTDIHNLALDLEAAGINKPLKAAQVALRFAVLVAPCRPEWFSQNKEAR